MKAGKYHNYLKSAIVFYGIAGCGKTTLSIAVSKKLPSAKYLAPSQFGLAHSKDGRRIQAARLKRYSRFFKSLNEVLLIEDSVVVDGCFDDNSIQNRLCEIIALSPICWTAIFCNTSDSKKTINRIIKRKGSSKHPDLLACTPNSFKETRNCSSKRIAHAILKNGGSHFTFDSTTNSLKQDSGNSIHLTLIKEIIKNELENSP